MLSKPILMSGGGVMTQVRVTCEDCGDVLVPATVVRVDAYGYALACPSCGEDVGAPLDHAVITLLIDAGAQHPPLEVLERAWQGSQGWTNREVIEALREIRDL